MAHDRLSSPPLRLTPDLMLRAYGAGIFPMADGRDDPRIYWLDPQRRGVFPLDGFHVSRSLARRIRSEPFEVTVDADFAGVVEACADRPETWINGPLRQVYEELHRAGHGHSVELWDGPDLVGGIFGLSIGGAFFGESMFSRRRDASKIALAYLVARLKAAGFRLFDTQFVTDHLISLGAVEIPRAAYRDRLDDALPMRTDFHLGGTEITAQDVLHLRTQTS